VLETTKIGLYINCEALLNSMATRAEVRDAVLRLGIVVEEFTPVMLPFSLQEQELVRSVLDEMAEEGSIVPLPPAPSKYRLTSSPSEILVDTLDTTDLYLRSTVYGPSRVDGLWTLYLSTNAGEIQVRVDNAAARDLWAEVKDVPTIWTD